MKYILPLLLLTGCYYNPDKIKYGDTVRITSGFYKDCIGIAEDLTKLGSFFCVRIVVSNLTCPGINKKTLEVLSVCDVERVL